MFLLFLSTPMIGRAGNNGLSLDLLKKEDT
jgi:hypothetical protein